MAYGENEIIFKTKYKYDIVVVRSLKLSDVETSNVSYNLDQIHNQISAPANLFSQVLTNFQLGDDDFGLETKSNKAILRNYDAGKLLLVLYEYRQSSCNIHSVLDTNYIVTLLLYRKFSYNFRITICIKRNTFSVDFKCRRI